MNTDEAHRRAEALFKKEQHSHEAQQAITEYEAELQALREKTARLRAASVGSRRRQSENADRALIVETLARLRSRSRRREATISQRHSGAA
jgi:hypothetical protein